MILGLGFRLRKSIQNLLSINLEEGRLGDWFHLLDTR
jgi:hypothetical protein